MALQSNALWREGNIFADLPEYYVVCSVWPVYLLRLEYKRKGILVAILGIGLSVTIEFMQLYLRRGTFELDDIFNNTIGAAIGALIAYGIECLCEKREKKNEKR